MLRFDPLPARDQPARFVPLRCPSACDSVSGFFSPQRGVAWVALLALFLTGNRRAFTWAALLVACDTVFGSARYGQT